MSLKSSFFVFFFFFSWGIAAYLGVLPLILGGDTIDGMCFTVHAQDKKSATAALKKLLNTLSEIIRKSYFLHIY